MKPTLVEDAEQAMAELRAAHVAGTPFALVISDVHMPVSDGFTLVEWIRDDAELADTSVIMLTSGAGRDDNRRCAELHIAGHGIKPVKQSTLFDLVVGALAPDAVTARAAPPITHTDLRPCRILLAEDNLVNRMVAQKLLAQWGHTIECVGNGREALASLEKASFDLVLMDIQMPELDGFEATAEIRRRERDTGAARIPIIAMTANAMKGDRERCLDAGMDGYVSKPVDREKLRKAIADLEIPDGNTTTGR
jgi:CheY-like chemotaxis protein